MERFFEFRTWVILGSLFFCASSGLLGGNLNSNTLAKEKCEIPIDQTGQMRAFQTPDKLEAEKAANLVMILLIFVFLGFSAIILLIAYFFEPSSKIHQSTKVKRGENFTPYKRSSRSPRKIRYEIDDED